MFNKIRLIFKPKNASKYEPMDNVMLFSVRRLALGDIYLDGFIAKSMAKHQHQWDPKLPEVQLLREYFTKIRDHRMIDIRSAQVLRGIKEENVPDRFLQRFHALRRLVD